MKKDIIMIDNTPVSPIFVYKSGDATKDDWPAQTSGETLTRIDGIPALNKVTKFPLLWEWDKVRPWLLWLGTIVLGFTTGLVIAQYVKIWLN